MKPYYEQHEIDAVMLAVQRYAFAVAKRDTTHAEGSASYRAAEAAIIAYGDWRAAACNHVWREVLEHVARVRALREGWHDGGVPNYHVGIGCPICDVADAQAVLL